MTELSTSKKLQTLLPIPQANEYDIDFVGTGTEIYLHNIMQRRNVEPIKKVEGIFTYILQLSREKLLFCT